MPRPNIHIESLEPAVHGGLNFAEFSAQGLPAGEILDFSVNSNPYGPVPGIKRYISGAAIDTYPDSESTLLRNKLSAINNVSPGMILAGSGSTELIRIIAAAYLSAEDTVIVPSPTYGEYEISSKISGASAVTFTAKEAENFSLDTEKLVNLVEETNAKLIFLCNPNNPTGQYLSQKQVRAVLKKLRDTLLVLDEAYIAFTENAWNSMDLLQNKNLVILRSMTKDFGLAGIRLGYLIASKEIVSILNKVKPPWNVSAIAQKAGLYSLDHTDYVKLCEHKIALSKAYLVNHLNTLKLPFINSSTNFILVRVGNASQFRQKLLKRGLLVRDCSSFGLPDYIRISPRTLPQCRKLIQAIKEIQHAG